MIVVIWCCHVRRSLRIFAGLRRDAAKRIVMAVSRLLGTVAACVILYSFETGHCKSYWGGCIKAAILICQQIFSILALIIFLFNKSF